MAMTKRQYNIISANSRNDLGKEES